MAYYYKIKKGNIQLEVTDVLYTRGGTKSPTLEIMVTRTGRRITPYEFRVRGWTMDMNNLFKRVYGPAIQMCVPHAKSILKAIEKEKAKGSLYHQPVILGREHGVIY